MTTTASRCQITPSVRGRATIHDKDILIYCISQLMAALNAGAQVSRTLQLTAHDLLVATNRETSGDAYRRLREAFERLAGTRITTNIVTGETEITSGFGLIETWEIVRKTRGGRMVSVAVTLSDWLYRAVLAVGADAEPRLFPAAQTAGAADLRTGAQALRPAAGMARLGRDAVQEIRLGAARAGCSAPCCAR